MKNETKLTATPRIHCSNCDVIFVPEFLPARPVTLADGRRVISRHELRCDECPRCERGSTLEMDSVTQDAGR